MSIKYLLSSIFLLLLLYGVVEYCELCRTANNQQIQIQTLQHLIKQQNHLLSKQEWLSVPLYKKKKQFLTTYQVSNLALKENLREQEKVYRLVYTSAFCPTSYIYQISNIGDSSFTFSKTSLLLEKVSELEFKLLGVSNQQETLSEEKWILIEGKIKQSMFWSLEKRNEKAGFDGYSYILEGVVRKNDYFHHKEVHRWVPEEGCFLELCRAIMELGGDSSGSCY